MKSEKIIVFVAAVLGVMAVAIYHGREAGVLTGGEAHTESRKVESLQEDSFVNAAIAEAERGGSENGAMSAQYAFENGGMTTNLILDANAEECIRLQRRFLKAKEYIRQIKQRLEAGKKIENGHYLPPASVKCVTEGGTGTTSQKTYPGDVYIDGIPMVDQGDKAYCAVATAMRVLSTYGIEMDEDMLATAMMASETMGTSLRAWEHVLDGILESHGLDLEMENAPLEPGLSWDRSASYEERHTITDDEMKMTIFNDAVADLVDGGDPIVWAVTSGLYNESPSGEGGEIAPADEAHSGHMRMIIGYNADRGEILFTDSWGEGNELKRMPADTALTITEGLFYVGQGQ